MARNLDYTKLLSDLPVLRKLLEPIGLVCASSQGAVWTYGGIRLTVYQVTMQYDENNRRIEYDGWYYMVMDLEYSAEDCPLSVRWRNGHYQIIWEPHMVIFGGSERINSWDNSAVLRGEVPV
jgi:hypothetical protein